MVCRYSILALAAFVAGTGCHAGLSGNTAKQEPPIPRETVTVKRFIDQHNKNASAIQSLSAEPRIVVSSTEEPGGKRVNGRLDMERPRGFRLMLSQSIAGRVADIGSNDEEFWFWVKDNKDKAIYFCSYKDVSASQLAVTYQPDWIIEAMGLREIDPREASTIAATRPPDRPGMLLLTQARRDNQGNMLTKETIVDETSGHIVEHRLYSGPKKDLLAKANVSQYFAKELKPTDANPSGSRVEIPKMIRLEWVAEKFVIDITLPDARVNPKYPPEQRTALFSEPTISGNSRKDLAQLSGPAASSSKVYETMPSPRPGVRLGPLEPMPMDVEGGLRTRSEPSPLSADLSILPDRPATVVGAPIPRGSDIEALQASARGSSRPAILDR
jgi:hypothetical protein